MVKRGLLLASITILFVTLIPLNAFAENTPATASSTFSIDVSDVVLQVTADETAHIDLSPISSATVFNNTDVTVNVATNNMTGYTMTMDVTTTDLTHTTITGNNAPVIPTLQSVSTQANFPANAWGYKITGDSYSPVLLTNSSPSWIVYNPTNSQDHIITLGASVDGSKESGTYTNTLTFNVVANPVANRDTVSFNKNNENATGTMPDQVLFQDGSSTINKNLFQLPGMKFMGWSTTALGTGDGVYYYGDEAVYVSPNPGMNNNITLYAQWAPDGTPISTNPAGVNGTTIQRAYEIAYTAMHKGMYEEQHEGQGDYAVVNSWPPTNEPYKNFDVRFAMQDMTSEICASVTVVHDDYQALDVRDNKLYHITKLDDGNCWMTQNLDLNIVSDANNPYTSEDTDLNEYGSRNYDSSHGYTKTGDIIKWVPSISSLAETEIDPSTGKVESWETTNHERNLPSSLDIGDWYWIGTWDNNGQSTYYYSTDSHYFLKTGYSGGAFSQIPYTGNGKHGHVGNYYNWTAAIASNDSTPFNAYAANSLQDNAPNSICPAGWRLPVAAPHEWGKSSQNDYYNLLEYYKGTNTRDVDVTSAPMWLERGADIQNDIITYAGREVQYWTSTPNGAYDAFFNAMDNYLSQQWYDDVAHIQRTKYKTRGTPIRCLAR